MYSLRIKNKNSFSYAYEDISRLKLIKNIYASTMLTISVENRQYGKINNN